MKKKNSMLTEMENESVREATPNDLKRLSEMAVRQLKMESEISSIEETLNEKKEILFRLKTEEIPVLMDEIGVESFTLKSGEKVEVKKITRASVTEEKFDSAYEWLKERGHESLVKNVIVVTFGRGEDKVAEKVASDIMKRGLQYSAKRSINSQTLVAFVKEQMEAGIDVPADIFGIFIYRESKIKRMK